MIHYILLDIEGTTTDIRFVHQVLFPYSARRLKGFVAENHDKGEVRDALESVRQTVLKAEGRTIAGDEAVDVLLDWIAEDRKHTALKTLQGLIWRTGYEQGDYRSHLYGEVPGCLKQWQEHGIRLGIYSSGSVQAQKLLFRYTAYGDLTPFFSHYFDTRVGGKKEPASYRTIATELAFAPETLLFLSDVAEELDAAREAGFQTIQICRDEEVPSTHRQAKDFNEVDQLIAALFSAN
jgi:enolase-phosphatase E1